MCATVPTVSRDRQIIAVVELPLSTKGVHFMRTTTDSAALTRTAGSVRTHSNGALNGAVRSLLLSLVLAGGISSGAALARTIIVEIAPPPARVEVVPVQRHGYTWAPGYWGWQRNQHVWVRGHTMRARTGYAWAPDRWNEVNGRHEFQRGRWTRGSESHAQ
jgi:WXXGXW repeat (2 copies)